MIRNPIYGKIKHVPNHQPVNNDLSEFCCKSYVYLGELMQTTLNVWETKMRKIKYTNQAFVIGAFTVRGKGVACNMLC